MTAFTAIIEKFDEKGEKSGWTYLTIPQEIISKLKPGQRTSFRVKGRLDRMTIKQVALIPMGDGTFILPFNASMRKATGRRRGEKISVKLEVDEAKYVLNRDLMICLKEEPDALKNFMKIPGSHQKYYSRWVDSAKTPETRARRIAHTVNAMIRNQSFGEMMREMKKNAG